MARIESLVVALALCVAKADDAGHPFGIARLRNHTQPRLLLIVGVQHSGTTLAEHFVMSHTGTVPTVSTCVAGSGCYGSAELRFDVHGNATRNRTQASTSSEYAPPHTPMGAPRCKDGQSAHGVMADRDCQRGHRAVGSTTAASGFMRDGPQPLDQWLATERQTVDKAARRGSTPAIASWANCSAYLRRAAAVDSSYVIGGDGRLVVAKSPALMHHVGELARACELEGIAAHVLLVVRSPFQTASSPQNKYRLGCADECRARLVSAWLCEVRLMLARQVPLVAHGRFRVLRAEAFGDPQALRAIERWLSLAQIDITVTNSSGRRAFYPAGAPATHRELGRRLGLFRRNDGFEVDLGLMGDGCPPVPPSNGSVPLGY